jgi:hypothetical protein
VKKFTFLSKKNCLLKSVLKFCFALFILGNNSFHLSAQTTKSVLFEQSSQSAEVEQGKAQSLLEYISTSDNNPASAKLTAVDDAGKIPAWLTVGGKILNGISYTTGSEISFNFDATNLSIGTYYATVTASATGYNNAVLNIKLSVIAGSSGTLANIKVNFQDAATVPPSGWLRDYGQSFALRTSAYQSSGNLYGWIKRSDKTPLDLTSNGRKRSSPSDILLATFIHMQGRDIASFSGTLTEGMWQAKVANGNYAVTVSVGDGTLTDSKHSINVEGVKAISGFVPTASVMFKSATVIVSVSDGYLTVDAIGGFNTKINWIIIKPYTGKKPSVVSVNPVNSSVNVSDNTSISTSVLKLPNSGINNATITTSNVYLTEEGTSTKIASTVNGTGGGDAITLVPSSPLKLSTTYRFTITPGVKDLSDSSFIPYSSTFTTGSTSSSELASIQFEKIALPNTVGQHSSLTVGPDGKLYALTIDGIIKRFTINADGTLGTPQLLYSLQDKSGTRTKRLSVGFAFDPSATATNLIAWVTNDTYLFYNAPDWDGKLTKLSGPNLGTVQDVLINLPRSKKDHVTNSIAFGPDRALYFTQASTSAMGRADQTWGYRDEHLLSGAVLRLDVSKLGSLPLDVKTSDGGGTYNPYNINAPLTIYASGVRNAYDLVWHSNGSLYTPTNGSAAGGNTPASVSGTLRPDGTTYNGPSIAALTSVQQTQKDWLFRIVKGGYYGHPNPTRGQYVMNGGNPTSGIDPAEVSPYPLGTKPDANYRGYAFDFQMNASPNGAIEYKSSTFNGVLKGKLLVVRYSQHDDIITLTPDATTRDITSATEGYSIAGFSGFNDPLDLTENTKNGNIYVSEYGGDGKIVLLKPKGTVKTAVKKTLTPIADARLRDGSYASTNYGSDTSLGIKGITDIGYKRTTYLKFSLDSVKNAYKAILRIHGYNTENFSFIKVSAFGVSNDTWTEKGITYSNAPASLTTPLSSVGISNEAKYYEFDITSYVKAQLAGDKIVSLVIKDTANQGRYLTFKSKENSINRPQLVITTDTVTQTYARPIVRSTMPLNMSAVRPSCDDPSEVVVPAENMALSIALTDNLERPKVYPNPLHKKFNIQIPGHYTGAVNLQIVDPIGKTFEIGKRQLKPGGTNLSIDISNLFLKPGVYFLKMNADIKTDLIKLIVQ